MSTIYPHGEYRVIAFEKQRYMTAFPKTWLLALGATALLCAFSLYFLDRSIADTVGEFARLSYLDLFATVIAESVIPISTIAIVYYCVQWTRGIDVARGAETLMIASCTMFCAFALNELLLKQLFGRLSLWAYLHQGRYGFDPFHGSQMMSGFPSGHTVMVVAFLSVLWRYIPRWRIFYAAIASYVSIMLVAGGWHFVSEIFAGIFLGLAAGMVASSLRSTS